MPNIEYQQQRHESNRKLVEAVLAQDPMPGEQLQAWSLAYHHISRTKMLLAGPAAGLFMAWYILAATDKRILLIRISNMSINRVTSHQSFALNEVTVLSDKGVLFPPKTRIVELKIGGKKYKFQYFPAKLWSRLDTVLEYIQRHA